MLLDAQVGCMEMTARVAYIIRITRITLKFIHNALLVYNYEGFVSLAIKSSEIPGFFEFSSILFTVGRLKM